MEDDAYFSLVSEFNSFSNGRITENIDFDDALRTFDESGEAKYSVEIPNENIHLTQNLIIGRDSLGTPYGFVFEYEADTSWVSENDNAVIWERFSGHFRVYGRGDTLLTEMRVENGIGVVPEDTGSGRINCTVYEVTVDYYVDVMTPYGTTTRSDGSYSYLETSGCTNYVPNINIRYDVYTGGLATDVHYPTLGGGNNTIGVATSVGQPCAGDPIKNPQIAGSKNNGVNGGRFGWRRTNKDGSPKFHEGLDIYANVGSNLYALQGGRVVHTHKSEHTDYGYYILIESVVPGEGNVWIMYAHLSAYSVSEANGGVSQGQQIGLTGRTGNGSNPEDTPNPHVHIEVRKPESGKLWNQWEMIDPESIIRTKFDNNGNAINHENCN